MFRHDPAHTGYSISTAPTTGVTQLWNYSAGGPVFTSPAVASGIVYVGSGYPSAFPSGDTVYALEASTGAKIWNYTTGGPVESSPAIAYGVVYISSEDGKGYALGTSSIIVSSSPSM